MRRHATIFFVYTKYDEKHDMKPDYYYSNYTNITFEITECLKMFHLNAVLFRTTNWRFDKKIEIFG